MRIDNNDHIYKNCGICGKEVRRGPHRYEGKILNRYGNILCCESCYEGNWDGWNRLDREPRLLKILEEKNLPIPERNENGLLPRE